MSAVFFGDVLTKYPLLGWIVAAVLVVVAILKHLSDTVSYLQVIKAQIWKPLAGKLKYKKLAKMAIKSDVEGRINKVVSNIQSELPKGWVEPISIQWVQEESKESFISDDRVVMKIEPLDKEEKNFAHALYIYLKKAFFPSTQSVLEDTHYEATMLQFCRRVINESKPTAYEVFEKDIMEPAVAKKQKILEYLERPLGYRLLASTTRLANR